MVTKNSDRFTEGSLFPHVLPSRYPSEGQGLVNHAQLTPLQFVPVPDIERGGEVDEGFMHGRAVVVVHTQLRRDARDMVANSIAGKSARNVLCCFEHEFVSWFSINFDYALGNSGEEH